MQNRLMELVEQSSMKPTLPKFEIGDTVDVHVRILEGEKERIQIFNGVVIAKSGAKTREMFVVRRIVQGEGVERKFPVHSPRIADIVVKRSGKVRRAKLYYLRDRSGKAVRLKERFPGGKATAAEAQGRQGREAQPPRSPPKKGQGRSRRRGQVGVILSARSRSQAGATGSQTIRGAQEALPRPKRPVSKIGVRSAQTRGTG